MSVRVLVLSIGAPRHPGLAAAIRDYESRAARYFDLESVEVQVRGGTRADPAAVTRAEGDALLQRLPPDLESFALTREGRALDSRQLADRLGEMATYGLPGAAFVIGGALGLDTSVLAACRHRLSLSSMTLPHELARLVLAEQLYRAGTLLRGEPYHKGA